MGTIGFIIYLLVIGLIAGAVARAVVPGRQSMGIIATIILGIIGSFIGGLIASLFTGGFAFSPAGIILSIIGAIIALLIYIALTRRRA